MSKSAGASELPTERSEAEVIAAAVLSVDDVAAMSAGPVGQFRSYLPGGNSVPGVRVDDDHLDVNIVSRYRPALPDLGAQIFGALAPLLRGRSVTVSVDDILLPGEPSPDGAHSIVDRRVARDDDADPLPHSTGSDH